MGTDRLETQDFLHGLLRYRYECTEHCRTCGALREFYIAIFTYDPYPLQINIFQRINSDLLLCRDLVFQIFVVVIYELIFVYFR